MNYKVKDSKALEKLIIQSGYTVSQFSQKIPVIEKTRFRTRAFMGNILKRGSAMPETVKSICKILSIDKEDYFEIQKGGTKINI
jgi:hypothetical protein